MPFPSKEIEEAYGKSVPIFQGSFKDDEELYTANAMQQAAYTELIGELPEETVGILDELIEHVRWIGEYEAKHAFAEGWRMAAERSIR
ncbi:MAG: hypothetical protein IJ705_09770 [Oscillospiraceae bacterium]|nr:hypothetical protein [Oscillospiraceae bacterium]